MPCNEWWEREDGGHGRVAAHALPYQTVIDILRKREQLEAAQLRLVREWEERLDEPGLSIWSQIAAQDALDAARVALEPLTAAVEQARREAYRRAPYQETLKAMEAFLEGRLDEYLERQRWERETLAAIGFPE